MTILVDATGDEPRGPLRRFLLIAVALWVGIALLVLASRWQAIMERSFLDADDQMRLLQVLDWLHGQSFYDVTQYRMNQPWGAPMHWSRLVDLPLAGAILALRPFLGADAAMMTAAALVPLLTLGGVLLAIGLIARRLAGDQAGLVAIVLSGMCVPLYYQIAPLRVDHHGWETCCSLLGLLAALDRRGARGGILAGVALAIAVQISLEQLPFAAVLGIALALRWLIDPGAQPRRALIGYTATLAGAGIVLVGVLHRPDAWLTGYCDAASPPQLILFAVAAIGVALTASAAPRTLAGRISGLGIAGAAALAAFHAYPPRCGLDAFSALEPIVRTVWLDNVKEGLPVWRQSPIIATNAIGLPLLAFACGLVLWRRSGFALEWRWLVYAVCLVGATALAVLVNRAGALASVMATPVVVLALLRLVRHFQRSARMPVRVLGTCAALVALNPISPLAAVSVAEPAAPKAKPADTRRCTAATYLRQLNALPRGRMLAGLDLTPPILFETRHAALASAHHRNHAAMAEVITAFMGTPATAHAIVQRRGLGYVAICPGSGETDGYRGYAPQGFMARLVRGERIAWLAPVPLPGSPLKVWRVIG